MQTNLSRLSQAFFLCLLVLATLNFAGCKQKEKPASSESKADLVTTVLPSVTLASGFNTGRGQKSDKDCLELNSSTIVYSGVNSSELNFRSEETYESLMNGVSGSVYGKFNLFGLVSAKIQGDVASSLATTDDSTSFLYDYLIQGKAALLGAPKFSEVGLNAVALNNLPAFRDACGDQFVKQVSLGAQLIFGAKYTFLSKEAKEKAALTLSGSALWGLIKWHKTWTKEESDILKNIQITVQAFQVGGNQDEFNAMKAGIYQGTCTADDAAKCGEQIDKIMAYAKDVFPKQLANMRLPEPGVTTGALVFDIVTENYRDAYIVGKDSAILKLDVQPEAGAATDTLGALDKLSIMRKDLNVAVTRANALINFPISGDEKARLTLAANAIVKVQTDVDATIKNTCVPALKDATKAGACIQQSTDLQARTDKAKVPLTIPGL